jgi:hypothetical protein
MHQLQKHLDFEKLYDSDRLAKDISTNQTKEFDYSSIDSLVKFTGTHPAAMQPVIQQQNWHFAADISKKNFTLKTWVLYYIERYTGRRLFDYRNYKII